MTLPASAWWTPGGASAHLRHSSLEAKLPPQPCQACRTASAQPTCGRAWIAVQSIFAPLQSSPPPVQRPCQCAPHILCAARTKRKAASPIPSSASLIPSAARTKTNVEWTYDYGRPGAQRPMPQLVSLLDQHAACKTIAEMPCSV